MPDQSDAKVIAGAWRMTSDLCNQEVASINGFCCLRPAAGPPCISSGNQGSMGLGGSAESGRYRMTGYQLCFHYEFKLEGGGGKPRVIDLASTAIEVRKIVLTSEILEIYCPSGNLIHRRPDPE